MTAIINDKGVVGDASGGAAVTDRGLVGYQPSGLAVASDYGLAYVLALALISTTCSDFSISSDAIGQHTSETLTDTSLTSDGVTGSRVLFRYGVTWGPGELGNIFLLGVGTYGPDGATQSPHGDLSLTSDSVARVILLPTTTSDTSLTSDTVVRSVLFSRVTSDTSLTADSVTRGWVVPRRASDTSSTTDAAVGYSSRNRITSDTSLTVDFVVRSVIFSRRTSDFSGTSDSVRFRFRPRRIIHFGGVVGSGQRVGGSAGRTPTGGSSSRQVLAGSGATQRRGGT